MWLRNWYSILNAIFLSRTRDTIPGTNPSDAPAISYQRFDGTFLKALSQNTDNYSSRTAILSPGKFIIGLGTSYDTAFDTKYAICLGSGTTPVSYNDYRIETPITSGLALAAESTTIVNKTALNNGRYSFKTRAAINNTSATQITINEVALNAPYYALGQSIASQSCCVYREVLSSPITLDPGDTVLVEFEYNGPIYQAPTP